MCDVVEPWEHGTVARTTRFPIFYDYNVVRVEGPDPGISVDELTSFGDVALAAYDHRRIDVDDLGAGERLRGGFNARGYRTHRILWLRWAVPLPEAPAMELADAEEVRPLRLEWALEEAWEPTEERIHEFLPVEAQVGRLRGGRWLVHRGDDGRPIAFVLLLVERGAAEIAQAYCTRAHRGRGIGTSLLLSAVREAVGAGCDDVWIAADDEGRPKSLYERLGFAPAWVAHEFTLIPRS